MYVLQLFIEYMSILNKRIARFMCIDVDDIKCLFHLIFKFLFHLPDPPGEHTELKENYICIIYDVITTSYQR